MKRGIVGLVFTLALGILMAPPAADAQQAGKIPRIGLLRPGPPPDIYGEAFRQGMRDLGYVEGRNIVIEVRYAEGKLDRLPELAAELVRLKVDVIVTSTEGGIRAAKEATSTIPIVFAAHGDPVGMGFVASLARPGGNITGFSTLAKELVGKRMELLREVFPRISRVAVLWNSVSQGMRLRVGEAEVAAKTLGISLQSVGVRDPDELDAAFSAMAKDRPDALVTLVDPFTVSHRKRIVDFAARSQLPAMYETRDFVDSGGLISYGPNIAGLYRRAAGYVDKILKGAKPADLPVEQPMRFELVINLKTAKALGLTIPQSVMVRADQVIQ